MKLAHKKILISVAAGALIVCAITLVYLSRNYVNHSDEKNELYRVYNNEPLYVLFNEECFTIQKGEDFDYFKAIKETNEELDSVNLVYIEYEKGTHEIVYVVRRSNEEKKYVKELIVI